MAEKDVVIYYRAGVEDFGYDTGFVKATDYEALRKRCEAVEADMRSLEMMLRDGTFPTQADAADWAHDAIAAAQELSHG